MNKEKKHGGKDRPRETITNRKIEKKSACSPKATIDYWESIERHFPQQKIPLIMEQPKQQNGTIPLEFIKTCLAADNRHNKPNFSSRKEQSIRRHHVSEEKSNASTQSTKTFFKRETWIENLRCAKVSSAGIRKVQYHFYYGIKQIRTYVIW